MNRLTILLLMLFASFVSFSVFANSSSCTSTSTSTSEITGFFIIGNNGGKDEKDFHYRMGKILPIKATGTACVDAINKAWTTDKKPIVLYFDGDKIATLESPPIMNGKEMQLNFSLARNADNDVSRKEWNDFFKKKRNHRALMDINPSIAISDELPVAVSSSPHPFKFFVNTDTAITSVLVGGIAILLAALLALGRWTNMLKDAETNYYSLGKTQMAFWGLLVVVSFVGIWIITGSMERIPPQILVLIGISGGTGLSAVVIGNGKRIEKQTQLTALEQEKQTLQDQKTSIVAPAIFPIESESRLTIIDQEIKKLEIELAPKDSTTGFWRDICSDDNGLSFHRFQVVIWTLVLGVIFIDDIRNIISMPEFSDTLLALMGISNGTYLGFKFPEK